MSLIYSFAIPGDRLDFIFCNTSAICKHRA